MDGLVAMWGALVLIYYPVFCMHSASANYDGLSPPPTTEPEPSGEINIKYNQKQTVNN